MTSTLTIRLLLLLCLLLILYYIFIFLLDINSFYFCYFFSLYFLGLKDRKSCNLLLFVKFKIISRIMFLYVNVKFINLYWKWFYFKSKGFSFERLVKTYILFYPLLYSINFIKNEKILLKVVYIALDIFY